MISVSLMGGLGNQMFQIASTYALARDNGLECGFDINKTYTPLQGSQAIHYADTLYHALPKINLDHYQFPVHKEPKWGYNKMNITDNILLYGYFQSPKYFDHRREEILNLYLNEITLPMRNNFGDIYSHILSDSIALHVRRGDYSKFEGIHIMLPVSYYHNAVNIIKKEHPIRTIMVFSDDIDWCRVNLVGVGNVFIQGVRDYEDLLLMSLCSHQILSPSSFSWWGAYLNDNPNKVVIAPKIWFGEKFEYSWEDIYLPNMIRI